MRKPLPPLTQARIDSTRAPKKEQPAKYIRCGKLRGYYARKTHLGVTYHAAADYKGRTKTINLTEVYGVTRQADARLKAQIALAAIKEGEHHPVPEEPQDAPTALTLGQARNYRCEHVAVVDERKYRERFDAAFGDWLHRPLKDITRDELVQRFTRITRNNGPVAANHAIVSIKAVIHYAQDNLSEERLGGNFRNPAARMKLNPEPPREPSWFIHDYPRVWQAFESHTSDNTRVWLMLLALTGLRNGTGRQLEWREVDFKNRLLNIPAKKMKRGKHTHTLPMGNHLYALLERHKRRIAAEWGITSWVFPTRTRGGKRVTCTQSPSYDWVKRATGLADWRPHDLRHLFGEVAHRIGVNPTNRSRLLAHADKGITDAVYLRRDVDALREPMQQIENYILGTVRGSVTSITKS